MSFRKSIICKKCHDLVWVYIPSSMPEPTVCAICREKERQRDLDEYLLERESMSTEERIYLMEKDLYALLDKLEELNQSLDKVKF